MQIRSQLVSCFIRACARCGRVCLRPVCKDCQGQPALAFTTPFGVPVRALSPYGGACQTMITRLKYGDETIFAGHLGRALAHILPSDWQDAKVIPIPLHPRRLAERGYNQAALLAVAMARQAHLNVTTAHLSRVRQTQAQARLGKVLRAENLRNAFRVNGLSQSSVILVDDVVTTGHTVDACAEVLQDSGNSVRGVLCCALARFEPSSDSHL